MPSKKTTRNATPTAEPQPVPAANPVNLADIVVERVPRIFWDYATARAGSEFGIIQKANRMYVIVLMTTEQRAALSAMADEVYRVGISARHLRSPRPEKVGEEVNA